MFKELDILEQERINNLTEEDKINYIKEHNIDIAIDINISVKSHEKITEEHTYYQVFSYGAYKLNDYITLLKITPQETMFKVSFNNEDNSFSINNGEEKIIEIGSDPYKTIYIIKSNNIRYGHALEL